MGSFWGFHTAFFAFLVLGLLVLTGAARWDLSSAPVKRTATGEHR